MRIKILSGLIILGLLLSNNVFSQVGIGTVAPNSAAMLEIESDSVGLLIPRINTGARELISLNSSSVSVLVYDTDLQKFMYWNSSEWLTLTPWDCNGESTSDIQTSTNGKIGIGLDPSFSSEKLQVNGSIKATDSIIATNITASNNIEAEGEFIGFGTVPIGGIIMWSGDPATIPSNWQLCDGQPAGSLGFNTPDLKGRFIVGYDSGDTDYDAIDKIGPVYTDGDGLSIGDNTYDSKKIKLRSTESGVPAHIHSINHKHEINDPEHFHGVYSTDDTMGVGGINRTADNTSTTLSHTTESKPTGITVDWYIGNTAGNTSYSASQAHENRPPYYVLAFIMRVQ